jgi:hypothetical protein
MKICSECGKKLRFFEGFIHPALGKNYLVCYKCYDYINKGMEFYRECLLEGRHNHKKECYFWDNKKRRCKNEQYFKNFTKKGK